jgi:hypothetical protein
MGRSCRCTAVVVVETVLVFAMVVDCARATNCDWSQWSSCSVTCGVGTRTRVGSGFNCTQLSVEECKIESCMVNEYVLLLIK